MNNEVSKLITRANAFLARGDYGEAAKLFAQALMTQPQNVACLYGAGVAQASMGRLGDAVRHLVRAATLAPGDFQVHHSLAKVFSGLHHYDAAANSCSRATTIRHDDPEIHNLYGNLLRMVNRHDLALCSWMRSIALKPNMVDAHANRAALLQGLERYSEALVASNWAVALRPDIAEVCNTRSAILYGLRRYPEALASCSEAIALKSTLAEALSNRGATLLALRRYGEAQLPCQKAIALRPDIAQTYNNLGAVLHGLRRYPEAIACYHKAIVLRPGDNLALRNLANSYREAGQQDKAAECYQRILISVSDDAQARLGATLNRLRIFYDTEEEMRVGRAEYRDALNDLANFGAHSAAQLAAAVGSSLPFYLAYQGKDDRELQQRYGQIICFAMAACYPEYAQPLKMPPSNSDRRLRVGIVSGYFRGHSNWNIPIKGWVEQLNRKRYELFGYYTDVQHDSMTAEARGALSHFVEGLSCMELMKRIAEDRLHMLIYPEIGMDSVTTQLAALRLAPLQCSSWGHPDTSGLPTIDYFLSSDLMEPEGASQHYTEQLVRLPNLSVYYTPHTFPSIAIARERFGLRKQNIIFFSGQSLFKYLPQYDCLFPAIARAIPESRFVFVAHASTHITERFKRRLERAFAVDGLDGRAHIVVVPHLSTAEFHGLMQASDVFLDNPEWSGCNTSLEAMGRGLPAITLPGQFMRGRHTFSFLKMMELDDLIASDIESYIALAIRMGTDPAAREEARKRITERLPCLYSDLECVRALEGFIDQAVLEYSS